MKKKDSRRATCGACGSDRVVSDWMRRDRESQFKARPREPTDSFYCGCQNEDDGIGQFEVLETGDH